MNENSLWYWLRDVALPVGHYSRIESPDTAPGFPDVSYQVGENHCGTIELKYCGRKNAKVPFPNEEKGLHSSQLRWIKNNLEHWGNIWIIAEHPPFIYIIHGSEAEHFNGATTQQLANLSVDILYRDEPEKAAKFLRELLIPWSSNKDD